MSKAWTNPLLVHFANIQLLLSHTFSRNIACACVCVCVDVISRSSATQFPYSSDVARRIFQLAAVVQEWFTIPHRFFKNGHNSQLWRFHIGRPRVILWVTNGSFQWLEAVRHTNSVSTVCYSDDYSSMKRKIDWDRIDSKTHWKSLKGLLYHYFGKGSRCIFTGIFQS